MEENKENKTSIIEKAKGFVLGLGKFIVGVLIVVLLISTVVFSVATSGALLLAAWLSDLSFEKAQFDDFIDKIRNFNKKCNSEEDVIDV